MTNKRILIFNVNWLGDVLFSSAAIRNIRRNFPHSFIACIVPSRCYHILKGNPNLDEIIIYDEKDRHRGLISKLKFISLLKAKRFDIVYLLHRSFTRAFITYLAGIPQRLGYYSKKRGCLLTKKIPPPLKDSLHRIDYYLTLIERAGLRIEDRFTDFFFNESDQQYVQEFLEREGVKQGELKVVISPAGNWPPKRWPVVRFAELIDRLSLEFKAKVIITAHINDRPLVDEILKKTGQGAINTCGRLNLKQLGALFKISDLVISSDSAPLHIANSVGAKAIIGLFGPTSVAVTGPYPLKNAIILQKDVGCKIPCYLVGCKDNRCMKSIGVQDIIEEIKKFKLLNS